MIEEENESSRSSSEEGKKAKTPLVKEKAVPKTGRLSAEERDLHPS